MFVYFYKEHKESEVTDIKLIALKLSGLKWVFVPWE